MKMLCNQYKHIWINTLRYSVISLSMVGLISLNGCSQIMSSKMPPGDISMEKAYQSAIVGDDDQSQPQSQQALRNKVKALQENSGNNSTSNNSAIQDIDSQFPQLSNPSILMYVYPHFVNSGNEQVPVPGYFTAFHLYDHNYYLPQN